MLVLYVNGGSDGIAVLELLLSKVIGETAAYGATLSLRHNGVSGVPDEPISQAPEPIHACAARQWRLPDGWWMPLYF